MSDPKSTPETNELPHNYPADLLEANANWARRLNQTFPQYFSNIKAKQDPKIIWIGCADPRVQESDALGALPGTALVHRNISNQVHPNDASVRSILAYALGNLDVQHVVVVGHNNCGGVVHALHRAALSETDETEYQYTAHDGHDEQSGNTPNDVVSSWLEPLSRRLRERGVRGSTEEVIQTAMEENVKLQVDNLTTPELGEFIRKAAKRPVWVHGWLYNFRSGFIQDLNITKVVE